MIFLAGSVLCGQSRDMGMLIELDHILTRLSRAVLGDSADRHLIDAERAG